MHLLRYCNCNLLQLSKKKGFGIKMMGKQLLDEMKILVMWRIIPQFCCSCWWVIILLLRLAKLKMDWYIWFLPNSQTICAKVHGSSPGLEYFAVFLFFFSDGDWMKGERRVMGVLVGLCKSYYFEFSSIKLPLRNVLPFSLCRHGDIVWFLMC